MQFRGAVQSGLECGSLLFTHTAGDAFAAAHEGARTVSTSEHEAGLLRLQEAALASGTVGAQLRSTATRAQQHPAAPMLSRCNADGGAQVGVG